MTVAHTHPFGILGSLTIPIGLGLLRLSTEGRPSQEQATLLLHTAFDQGVRLLDTADCYCLDNSEFHYGERLAQQAVASWQGPRESIRIITKVGLVRPAGKWIPNGTPKHIRQSVDGMLLLSQQLGIPFLAYRPLGGYAKVEKLEKNRILMPLSQRHNVSPHEIALAAVLNAGPNVIPLVGATKQSSLLASINATNLELDISDRTALSIKYAFEADTPRMSFCCQIGERR